MTDLKNKNALITGAGKGIGKAIALALAKEGVNIILVARTQEEIDSVAAKVRSLRVKALAITADVADINSVNSAVEKALAEFGTIDILINNAGITKDNLLMRMSEEDFDKVIEINLKSVFNMTKAVQKVMLKNRKGSIVNISSVVGVKGNAGQANYAASKAGMIGFTKSVALELGSRNIRCNAIAPGFIETEMTAKLNEDVVQGWRDSIPLKRGGTPEDVANACLFLASDMSAYVSGQVLNVCGGMLT